ncbi:ABC transporter ATP-binding protein [Platysternon megacephalum]|uniref:ABC transporter ATP-binding protein n=1 Tax=Platysternon megacephalum TaxID=55544 RepID=A0A4D9DN27_9SAUR|nr:ABC transporter ATP-binding protein [Platysternon megacephalum]
MPVAVALLGHRKGCVFWKDVEVITVLCTELSFVLKNTLSINVSFVHRLGGRESASRHRVLKGEQLGRAGGAETCMVYATSRSQNSVAHYER